MHRGKGFICVTREFIMGYFFFNVMFFFTFEAVIYAFGRKSKRVHSRSPFCQAIQSLPRDSIVNGLSHFFPETLGANTSMYMYAFFSFFLNGSTVYILFYGCFLTTYLGGHFLSLYIELLHYFFRTSQYSIIWMNQNLISPLLPSHPSALNLGI